MKNVILVLIGILTLSCSKRSDTHYSTNSEKVFLIITENTTETELTKIVSEFIEEKNIIIDFSGTEFTKGGKIRTVNLNVDCNDGFKGTAKSSSAMLEGQKFGFSRDYTKNAKSPFVIGAM